ncbi:MAG: enoyl-CoA hydratase/isomerase family protein [Anaerolineae bacterium]|nr:enoyl-CoA hydratase/isomerase family protein [Anaerolineae bacterium]
MKAPIITEINDNGIAILRVNRPQARNALNWVAQEAFATAVSQIAQNDNVRILIITGTGDQAFVAGGDLKELANHPEPAAGERLNRVMSRALAELTELPIPVIAAVNGDAFGGGCEILTACDLRLCAHHAHFSFAQVKNGLTTGWGGTGRLVQLIGQSQASELLLTARLFNAAEAHRLGLIHRIVPAGEEVVTAAIAWAEEMLPLPKRALTATKALAHAAVHMSLPETYVAETNLFVNLWSQPDHLEALNAFVEKRKPAFNKD